MLEFKSEVLTRERCLWQRVSIYSDLYAVPWILPSFYCVVVALIMFVLKWSLTLCGILLSLSKALHSGICTSTVKEF